jgi:hypothetical protein
LVLFFIAKDLEAELRFFVYYVRRTAAQPVFYHRRAGNATCIKNGDSVKRL